MSDILRRYGIKEVADVTFYELDNDLPGKPVLVLDTLKLSNIEQSAESTDAKGGKGNASLITWDYGKEIILNIEDALFSPKSLSLANGIDYSNIIDTEKARTLERMNIYRINKDLPIWETKKTSETQEEWKPLLQEEMIANQVTSKGMLIGGKFVFGTVSLRAISGIKIDLWKTYTDKQVQDKLKADCFYEHQGKIYLNKGLYLFTVQSEIKPNYKIEITSDTFPGTYYVVGDTYIRDENTGRDKLFQFVIPKAKILLENNTIAMEAEGDPTIFNMSLKVLKPESGPMMYCQDYVDYYGAFAEFQTFIETINPELSETEQEKLKEEILIQERENNNIFESEGITYVTRRLPLKIESSEARVMLLKDEQQITFESSLDQEVSLYELPQKDTDKGERYSDVSFRTSVNCNYGGAKTYTPDKVIPTKPVTQKNTGVAEIQRKDGVLLSLANIDSIEFNEKEMRLKIFLDESEGHAWLDIKGDEQGIFTFAFCIDINWLWSAEGMAWAGMMAARTTMDIITIFNPFGAAGNLLVRGGLRLISRLVLRTTVFQIDEGFLADTGYSDLVYTAIDYIKQEVKEIIVGGN